jgi:PAS domain S-box-containing protein
MAGNSPTDGQLKQRLEDLEAIIEALRGGRIDAIVGKDGVALLRLAEVERQLRESEARYRLMFNRNPDGVFAVDPAGRFLEANPACEAIFGYALDELQQKTFLDICAPDQVSDTVAAFERGLRERRYSQFETASVHKDGRRVEVWIAGEPIVSDGRVSSIQCTARDITGRKQVERALQHLNATLEQQVAARTALAEQRAHDLRRLAAELSRAEHNERKRLANLLHDQLQQLLMAVRLQLPVLAEVDPPERERHLAKLDGLLVECLTVSRNLTQELSPPILQMGTLPETIRWLGAWFRERHGLNVTVESENGLPETPEHLRIFLFHAARELLFNVIKHSGRLEARVELAGTGGWLTLQVEDQGANFDAQAVEALVERPEGFGVFNIRERLKALGGRLEIEATPRRGACFRLVIPLRKTSRRTLSRTQPRSPK